MDCRALASHRLPHQSKLFLDYVGKFSRVETFYSHAPKMASVIRVARELNFPDERRREVAAILREQNVRFGSGPATIENLARLKKARSRLSAGNRSDCSAGRHTRFTRR